MKHPVWGSRKKTEKIRTVYAKRFRSVLCVISIVVVLGLYNWTYEAAYSAYVLPEVKKQNLYSLVRNPRLSEGQIQIVSQQTGVSESVVRQLLEQGMWRRLLQIQETYFASIEVECMKSTPLTVCEKVSGVESREVEWVPLRDGDILITKNSRFLGWRNGHAGLVVDAEEGIVLEALVLGTDTGLFSVDRWKEYPSLKILRLKEQFVYGSQEDMVSVNRGESTVLRSEWAADYGKGQLCGIPYRLTAGVCERLWERIGGKPNDLPGAIPSRPKVWGTQCAHLVWYAYQQAGIDLDADGGLIVTPSDLSDSPYLEVVQAYGY